MLKGFKDFIFRPGLVETGVGLVMALATVAVLTALVENIIMPIVGILFGEPNFDDVMILTVNGSEIRIGAFLTALVSFLAIGFAVYFFIVKPYQSIQDRMSEPEEEEEAGDPEDIVLLREIRDALNRG